MHCVYQLSHRWTALVGIGTSAEQRGLEQTTGRVRTRGMPAWKGGVCQEALFAATIIAMVAQPIRM
jgi:hypothetical protein